MLEILERPENFGSWVSKSDSLPLTPQIWLKIVYCWRTPCCSDQSYSISEMAIWFTTIVLLLHWQESILDVCIFPRFKVVSEVMPLRNFAYFKLITSRRRKELRESPKVRGSRPWPMRKSVTDPNGFVKTFIHTRQRLWKLSFTTNENKRAANVSIFMIQ